MKDEKKRRKKKLETENNNYFICIGITGTYMNYQNNVINYKLHV